MRDLSQKLRMARVIARAIATTARYAHRCTRQRSKEFPRPHPIAETSPDTFFPIFESAASAVGRQGVESGALHFRGIHFAQAAFRLLRRKKCLSKSERMSLIASRTRVVEANIPAGVLVESERERDSSRMKTERIVELSISLNVDASIIARIPRFLSQGHLAARLLTRQR